MAASKWLQIFLLLIISVQTVSAADNYSVTNKVQQTINKNAKKTETKQNRQIVANKIQQNNLPLLRIGSGAVGGNYFVLGELVGGVVSHPAGSLACGQGGTCGVANLQTQNITSPGSVANLEKLIKGDVETAFVQSDIAYWAYTGTGLFKNKDKMTNIRAIASLYPEAMHIIVKKGSGINSIADMKNKRVSVGERKSGTLYGTRLILDAYNLSEDDMKTEYLTNVASVEKFKKGTLDAVFFTTGTPAPIFEALFNDSNDYKLLGIGQTERQKIFKQAHYFSPYTIKSNTYKNIKAINTISVNALWLTTDKTDETLVYQ
ncbi:MAG: TAXI family TRAP transporter solute-binding subunit [Ostreibacterium sp.]